MHRVQRVPATEASGRIHTSTATVAVLPEAEEVDIQIQEKDLRIDTFCSSGPGGQSVNTTYSAVRITHLPTGLVVSQQDEKSQIKNRAKALKVLRSRLYEIEMQKQHDAIAKDRRSQVGTGERSEKIRTYNFRESRITDHRINFTTHQLTSVLDGDLGELIDVVTSHYQAEALKNATTGQPADAGAAALRPGSGPGRPRSRAGVPARGREPGTGSTRLPWRTVQERPCPTSVSRCGCCSAPPPSPAIAILSLAIGIGANAAIFSLYNQMLLRPLPVRDPYGLVNLGAPGPKHGSQSSNNAGSQRIHLQLPDVPRPREGEDQVQRHRRASPARGEPGVQGPDHGRARACSSRAATSACSA